MDDCIELNNNMSQHFLASPKLWEMQMKILETLYRATRSHSGACVIGPCSCTNPFMTFPRPKPLHTGSFET